MYNTEKVIDWHLILLKYQEKKKKYFPFCALFPTFSPKPAFYLELSLTT